MPSIAVIGASADRSKFGNKAVRAYQELGWTVYPVHPSADEIEGLKVYPTIAAVPRPIERVSMYLPAAQTVALLDDIAAAAPAEFWLNPGSASDELIEAAQRRGLNVIVACSIVDVGASPRHYG
jgi:hypothetical protein